MHACIDMHTHKHMYTYTICSMWGVSRTTNATAWVNTQQHMVKYTTGNGLMAGLMGKESKLAACMCKREREMMCW